MTASLMRKDGFERRDARVRRSRVPGTAIQVVVTTGAQMSQHTRMNAPLRSQLVPLAVDAPPGTQGKRRDDIWYM